MRTTPALLIAVLVGPTLARADVRWTASIEGGSEYDSNIHRLERVDGQAVEIEGSPLMRTGARVDLAWPHGERRRLLGSALSSYKIFLTPEGQGENVIVVGGDLRYEWLVPRHDLLVTGRTTLYDAISIQPFGGDPAGRNFAAVGAELAATLLGPDAHRLTGYGGYRWFEYKPDPEYDWDGDHWGLRYQTTLWRGDPDADPDADPVDLVLDYRLDRRAFAGVAYTNMCGGDGSDDPRCFVPTMLGRRDTHHAVSAELVYTGDRIYSGRYELRVNDSNSYGQSWLRQRLELGVTTGIPLDLYLTVRATVQLNTFLDPLLLARDVDAQTFVSIEEENRNALSVHLSRALAARWTGEARYALYTNEFASREVSFRRQIAYLGLVYRYR